MFRLTKYELITLNIYIFFKKDEGKDWSLDVLADLYFLYPACFTSFVFFFVFFSVVRYSTHELLHENASILFKGQN